MVIKKKVKYFDLRIPRISKDLHSKLSKSADTNKRTLAAEALIIIENYFKKESMQ